MKEISQTDLWMTLSSKLDKGRASYPLKEGDELKMGRIQFKVLQVSFDLIYREILLGW